MNQDKQALSQDLNEKQQMFYMGLAKDYLRFFDNHNPSINQLCGFQSLLCQAWVPHFLAIDSRLTQEESTTLYLSARGKTTKQIARICDVCPRQVERYRTGIFKKLHCKNIAEAVMKGIQFLEIKPYFKFKEEE